MIYVNLNFTFELRHQKFKKRYFVELFKVQWLLYVPLKYRAIFKYGVLQVLYTFLVSRVYTYVYSIE